jgi:hypothetical protein
MALTNASPTYSTRRLGTADAGIEVFVPMYQATAQNSITPSTSAAWMIRALMAGDT